MTDEIKAFMINKYFQNEVNDCWIGCGNKICSTNFSYISINSNNYLENLRPVCLNCFEYIGLNIDLTKFKLHHKLSTPLQYKLLDYMENDLIYSVCEKPNVTCFNSTDCLRYGLHVVLQNVHNANKIVRIFTHDANGVHREIHLWHIVNNKDFTADIQRRIIIGGWDNGDIKYNARNTINMCRSNNFGYYSYIITVINSQYVIDEPYQNNSAVDIGQYFHKQSSNLAASIADKPGYLVFKETDQKRDKINVNQIKNAIDEQIYKITASYDIISEYINYDIAFIDHFPSNQQEAQQCIKAFKSIQKLKPIPMIVINRNDINYNELEIENNINVVTSKGQMFVTVTKLESENIFCELKYEYNMLKGGQKVVGKQLFEQTLYKLVDAIFNKKNAHNLILKHDYSSMLSIVWEKYNGKSYIGECWLGCNKLTTKSSCYLYKVDDEIYPFCQLCAQNTKNLDIKEYQSHFNLVTPLCYRLNDMTESKLTSLIFSEKKQNITCFNTEYGLEYSLDLVLKHLWNNNIKVAFCENGGITLQNKILAWHVNNSLDFQVVADRIIFSRIDDFTHMASNFNQEMDNVMINNRFNEANFNPSDKRKILNNCADLIFIDNFSCDYKLHDTVSSTLNKLKEFHKFIEFKICPIIMVNSYDYDSVLTNTIKSTVDSFIDVGLLEIRVEKVDGQKFDHVFSHKNFSVCV
jgi:hypothetical protein